MDMEYTCDVCWQRAGERVGSKQNELESAWFHRFSPM